MAKIRRDPTLYMSPGRRAVREDLALELASDAVYLGAKEVLILHNEPWTVVAASTDWISQGSKWQPEECFFRLEFIHQYRNSANRATVLLGAFATDIVVFESSTPTVVLGAASNLEALSQRLRTQASIVRAVAFQMPSAA